MLNELFRSYKKIIILAVLLGSGIIFWFFSCHREAKHDQPIMEWERKEYTDGGYSYHFKTNVLEGNVVFGIKGYMVRDKNVPVFVTIDSAKENFSGIIKISVPGNNSGGIAYQSALQCQKNEKETRIFTVPQLGNASYFIFQIEDQYENVILSEKENLQLTQWDDQEDIDQQLCIGILSDAKDQLAYFEHLKFMVGEETVALRTIHLNSGDFPQDMDSLEMISGILIDDYDVSQLSKKQLTLLKTWVKGGGHLILATGNHGHSVLKAFSKELHIQSGPVEMGRLYFGEDTGFSGEIGLYLNQLRFLENAGWKMEEWSDPASFYEKNYGKGLIHVVRFSFADEALLQWNRLDEMAGSIMSRLMSHVLEDNDTMNDGLWDMEIALNDFIQSQMPNAFFYGVFFIIYLITLTVVAYFLLRKQKKSEYIWIVVPVLSICFSFLLLVRSRGSYNVTEKDQNSMSVIRVVDNDSKKNEIYFLYQNAEGEGKNLDFIPAIDQVKPLDYEYGQEEVDASRLRIIKEDYTVSRTIKGYNIFFSETTPGTTRMLEMSENKSMNYGEKPIRFSTDLKGDYTSFSGTIHNSSDKNFDKILVIRGNQYWLGDAMKKGENITVRKQDIHCFIQKNSEEEELFGEKEPTMIQDLLSYISNRYLKNNTNLGEYIIVGIALDDTFQLLKGGEYLGNQVSIYVNHEPASLQEMTECQTDINLQNIKEKLSYTDLLSRMDEEMSVDVTYQFDSNKLAWALARNLDDYQGKIYAYNYETEKMDEILSKPGDVLPCQKLEVYLSEMNEMKLIYEQSEDTMGSGVPVLSMWMKKTIRK